jgi:hypothetical protein
MLNETSGGMRRVSIDIRRYAVTLNNIGVSQLERKCCINQVLATLKDSLSIVHSMVHDDNIFASGDDVNATEDEQVFLSDAKTKHEYAMSRLSNPLFYNSEYTFATFETMYLSDLDQSTESATGLNENTTSFSIQSLPKFCVLRLDGLLDTTIRLDVNNNVGTDSTTISESFVPDMETAIILYNLGVTTFCMYLSCPSRFQHYQMAGIKLLQSSYTLYAKALHKSSLYSSAELATQESELSYLCPTQLLVGLTVVLDAIVKSLMLSSQSDKAALYQTILNKVQSRIKLIKEAKGRLGLCPPSSSAA